MLPGHKQLLCLAISLLALSNIAFAQQGNLNQHDTAYFQIGLSEHIGKLVKIHGEFPSSRLASVTEVGFMWQRFVPNGWQGKFGFPAYGLSLVHAQFGNQNVLGQSVAAIPVMRFERWIALARYSFQAGFGLAWFNKPYDAKSNPENLVIGSRFANMSMMRADVSTALRNRCTASFGLSFTHCSNSHFAVPNIGANILAVHAGFSLHSKSGVLRLDNSFYDHESDFPKEKSPWMCSVHSIFGLHEAIGTIRPVDGPRYPVYGIGIFASKSAGRGLVSLGLNYHYYTYMHDYIISQELFDAALARRNSQTAVLFAGYEWCFGQMTFFVQGGLNVYAPFIKQLNEVWDLPKQGILNLWTSNKLGYRFYIKLKCTAQPFLQLAVKANGGTADFFELGAGIRFSQIHRRL